MNRTVSQVARLVGVSVRTLHHYDEIGLLRPSERSEAGYRLYSAADLERLQQVLFFRALDFQLDEVARIMTDRDFDVGGALRLQRQLLEKRLVETRGLIAGVDAALTRFEKGHAMAGNEAEAVFKDFNPEDYEDEVEQRWGDTEAYMESKRRTARYTPHDWDTIKKEGGDLFVRLADLMTAGKAPADAAAVELAEAHRKHIERWFYPCPKSMHRALGEGYVDDPRFTANIDRIREGLSRYLRDAFRANAERA